MTERVPVGEPFGRFDLLLASAKGLGTALLPEPTAFTLATVGADGRPTAPNFLRKGVAARGFGL